MKIRSAEDRNNGEGKEENDWRMKSFSQRGKEKEKGEGKYLISKEEEDPKWKRVFVLYNATNFYEKMQSQQV